MAATGRLEPRLLARWGLRQPTPPFQALLEGFRCWASESGWSQGTIEAGCSAVRQFLFACEDAGITTAGEPTPRMVSDMVTIVALRYHGGLGRWLSVIWDAADATAVLPRFPIWHLVIPAILRVICCCGLRPGEARTLPVEGVDLDRRRITITESKGHHARQLPLAEGLAPPASSPNNVDEGVTIIISRAPEEVSSDPSTLDDFEGFFSAIRMMVDQSEIGLGAVSNLISQIEPVEKMSRDLRKPLRTLREGLTLFVDGLSVMRGWIVLIEEVEPLSGD